MTTIQNIRDFLGLKRLAVVGVSRNPQDFTRTLFRELLRRGYDVVPVNPNLAEVEGLPCLPHVQDVSPPVEGALLLTKPSVTDQVVRECAQAGVRRVWMYRAAGAGAVSQGAVGYCQSNGIDLVEGECPFMFLEGTSWPHRLHGFCRKMLGRYPQ
ncbi:MAG: CoA-binding protein [Acidobacteriia bacterium]|nr:CoA-binding protein [Terriglobia bacterium]